MADELSRFFRAAGGVASVAEASALLGLSEGVVRSFARQHDSRRIGASFALSEDDLRQLADETGAFENYEANLGAADQGDGEEADDDDIEDDAEQDEDDDDDDQDEHETDSDDPDVEDDDEPSDEDENGVDEDDDR